MLSIPKSPECRLILCGVLTLLATGCQQKPSSIVQGVQEPVIKVTTETSMDYVQKVDASTFTEDIKPWELTKVVPTISRLQAVQPIITMRSGQSVSVATIKILAFDKDGRSLGTLPFCNYRVDVGAVELQPPNTIVAKHVGKGSALLSVPMYKKYGGVGEPPSVSVVIEVTE